MRGLPTALVTVAAIATLIHPCRSTAADDAREDGSPWGIATGAEWSGDYPKFDPLLHHAGVRWLRMFDEWQTIQPRPGEWHWEDMDAKVADASKNNIRIIGGLWFFAPWTSATGDTRTGPVKDIKFWHDYAAGAFTRYQKQIKYWEIWNEFNGSFYNTTSGSKAKDYAALVREAYDTARKIDPELRVGISCANFDLGFFDAAIKAGAADHFDFVAVHPYENLGLAVEGNEASYLSLAGSIRKMLADNHQRQDIPLWITEIGFQTSITPNAEKDSRQADAIVKAYILSLAQGFDKIFWFEARGPAYGQGTDHGIIRKDWSVRPSYTAMKTMTDQLGAVPKLTGWLDTGGAYGFLFAGRDGEVLVTWAPPGKATKIPFIKDVKVVDEAGQSSSLPAGGSLNLTTSPVFVTQLPDDVLAAAHANLSKPFPWGGGYADATEVSCRLAATNIDKGVTQVHLDTTEVVNLLDQSYRRTAVGRGGEGFYAYFRADPQFATFGTKALEITVTAKRADQAKPASFQLTYESLTGYKGVQNDRWTVPAGNDWSSHTWKVTDANFVGGWGWNFRTDGGGSAGDMIIKEVTVKRIEAK